MHSQMFIGLQCCKDHSEHLCSPVLDVNLNIFIFALKNINQNDTAYRNHDKTRCFLEVMTISIPTVQLLVRLQVG